MRGCVVALDVVAGLVADVRTCAECATLPLEQLGSECESHSVKAGCNGGCNEGFFIISM